MIEGIADIATLIPCWSLHLLVLRRGRCRVTRAQLLEEVIKLSTTGDERLAFAKHRGKSCYQCRLILERIRQRFHAMAPLLR